MRVAIGGFLALVAVVLLVQGIASLFGGGEDPSTYPTCASIAYPGVDMNARCNDDGDVVKFRDTDYGRRLSGVID